MEIPLFKLRTPVMVGEIGDLADLEFGKELSEVKRDVTPLNRSKGRWGKLRPIGNVPIKCPRCMQEGYLAINPRHTGLRYLDCCSYSMSIKEYNAWVGTRTIKEIASEIADIWVHRHFDTNRKFKRFRHLLSKLQHFTTADSRWNGESGREAIEEFISLVMSPQSWHCRWWVWSGPLAQYYKAELLLKITEIHVDYRWDKNAHRRYWENQK